MRDKILETVTRWAEANRDRVVGVCVAADLTRGAVVTVFRRSARVDFDLEDSVAALELKLVDSGIRATAMTRGPVDDMAAAFAEYGYDPADQVVAWPGGPRPLGAGDPVELALADLRRAVENRTLLLDRHGRDRVRLGLGAEETERGVS